MNHKAKHYPEIDANPDFPKIEEAVLTFWEKEKLFGKSIENRKAAEEFIFYDGPPFANGLPHYGHLLTGYVKDLYARYQTMRGKRVERRFGWDCHGLPAEMGSEKELGISGRAAITNFGIGKFNDHCRTSVMKYTKEWEEYVTRQARWVDFKHDYKTMDTNFMESVLWAFKQLYDKGLVYEAYRVMPYSWAAETPLSNFETKLDNSYREREDKAITVAFELNTPPKGAPKADKYYVLAWTTTPWTLPSNLALAVGDKVKYQALSDGEKCFIFQKPEAIEANKMALYLIHNEFLHANRINGIHTEISSPQGNLIAINPEAVHKAGQEILVKNLLGLSYHPLFPYFANHKHAFKILDGSSFVTDADGTGIVHMAPGFGEDDQKVAEANGIEIVVPVDGQGKFTDEIYDLPDLKLKDLNVIAETQGQTSNEPYKPEQVKKYGLANLRIINWLKNNGKLIKQEEIKHNYPHCWRTDQPLIYRAMPSWYVEVTKFRDRAVELNKQINWIPEHIRDGQMGHMLATAPDWSISRNRFWGTPIPVWRSKSGKIKVYGSIAELEKASGKKITDLHRPAIDEIVITEGGEEYKRVEDVFDCWFESGSMPFAQVHYPFENKEWFETHFPADFITEYVGQTRGWFNTLIMLSTALFDKPPFKNCICHGVVLDSETGLKYSKRLKNYKDPMEVMDKFGADALRWLMISSPVMRGQDLAVDPEGKFIRDVVRLAIKPIWNAYNFFTLYANADGIKAKFATDSQDVMDRYILAKCKQAVETIEKLLDAYDTPGACDAVSQFFEALNNWYIRRNKERFWKEKIDADKQAAYDTLYTVLTTMCAAAAPLLPLTLDDVYKGLTGEESVHLAEFPDVSKLPQEIKLVDDMDRAREVCNAVLSIRNNNKIRVRLPLAKVVVACKDPLKLDYLQEIIADETNVEKVEVSQNPKQYADQKKIVIKPSGLKLRLIPEGKDKKIGEIIAQTKKPGFMPKIIDDDTVEIAGEKIYRSKGEWRWGWEALPNNQLPFESIMQKSGEDIIVVLDTTITPELEAKGIARDLVRMIQQARKDAGLNVSDRIALSLDTGDAIAKAAKTHDGYIKEQTLAATLSFEKPATATFTAENTLDDHKVTIALSKCA